MAGQRAQVPFRSQPLSHHLALARPNRPADEFCVRDKEIAHQLRAFFGLERAGGIDQETARFHQLGGTREQALLQRNEPGNIGLALDPGNFGMAPNGAGARTRCIKEDGVEACAANPSLQTWPAAYREGTVHGLLFDRNGYVSPNPWGAKHIALIMAAHPDPAAILEDLAVKLRSAEWEYSYAVDRGLRSP